jgi:hypothetical protein
LIHALQNAVPGTQIIGLPLAVFSIHLLRLTDFAIGGEGLRVVEVRLAFGVGVVFDQFGVDPLGIARVLKLAVANTELGQSFPRLARLDPTTQEIFVHPDGGEVAEIIELLVGGAEPGTLCQQRVRASKKSEHQKQ